MLQDSLRGLTIFEHYELKVWSLLYKQILEQKTKTDTKKTKNKH